MTTARDAIVTALAEERDAHPWVIPTPPMIAALVLAALGIPPDATLPLVLVRDDEARIERAARAVELRMRRIGVSEYAYMADDLARAALAAADQEKQA